MRGQHESASCKDCERNFSTGLPVKRPLLLVFLILVTPLRAQGPSAQDTYVITKHTSVPAKQGVNWREEQYTIAHGTEIRITDPNPDLSQIPKLGVPIRACVMHGDAVAIQPEPAPCISRNVGISRDVGSTLTYWPSPNSDGASWVTFEILSEEAAKPSTITKGQSATRKKSVPAIAKETSGAVVSIVMADKSGRPIAQGSGFVEQRWTNRDQLPRDQER